MASVCVVTQDPRLTGGVLTRLIAFLRYATTRGHTCDIYYPVIGNGPGSATGPLGSLSSLRSAHPVRVPGELPHFARAHVFGRRCPSLRDYDAHLLISGSLITAAPLVRQQLPFAAWVAGSFQVEIKHMPRTKVRHFYLYNTPFNYLTWRQEKCAGRAAKVILPVSTYSAERLRRSLGLPAGKFVVLPGPVDTIRFRPLVAGTSTRPYVLSVSRLERGKGFPTLLKAFRCVADQVPDIELRIVGDGKERHRLENLSRKLGLEGRVTFTGELNGRRLAAQYRNARVFAFASRQEALGNVLLEAMASGVPVVTTDCGGSADPIIPGRSGLVVAVDDWKELAASILLVLRDSQLAAELGHAGRRKAIAEYGVEVVSGQLDSVFENVFSIQGEVARAS